MTDERALVKDEKGREEISLATIGARAEREAREVLEVAKARARVVAELIKDRGLTVKIGNKEYVECEGWVTLASSYSLVPEIEWTRPLRGDAGWEARAVLVDMRDGTKRGAGEAECRFAEENWAESESYAVRSMAQTRAVSKVCRVRLSAVMVLAGYAPTPAEEMAGVKGQARPPDGKCRECGADVWNFRDGKYQGHKLPDGKTWHRQAIPRAPATKPDAPAGLVDAAPTAQVPEVVTPRVPVPESVPELMARAKDELHFGYVQVCGIEKVTGPAELKVKDLPAIWARLLAAAQAKQP